MLNRRKLTGTFAATALALVLLVGARVAGGVDLVAQTDTSSCGPEQLGPLCAETRTCYFFFFCGEPTRIYWPSPERDGGASRDDPGEADEPTGL